MLRVVAQFKSWRFIADDVRIWFCGGRGTIHFGEEGVVAVLVEEATGVEAAFAPGFFGALGELPVEETGAEMRSYGLSVVRAVVVAEAIKHTECMFQYRRLMSVQAKSGGVESVPMDSGYNAVQKRVFNPTPEIGRISGTFDETFSSSQTVLMWTAATVLTQWLHD